MTTEIAMAETSKQEERLHQEATKERRSIKAKHAIVVRAYSDNVQLQHGLNIALDAGKT